MSLQAFLLDLLCTTQQSQTWEGTNVIVLLWVAKDPFDGVQIRTNDEKGPT